MTTSVPVLPQLLIPHQQQRWGTHAHQLGEKKWHSPSIHKCYLPSRREELFQLLQTHEADTPPPPSPVKLVPPNRCWLGTSAAIVYPRGETSPTHYPICRPITQPKDLGKCHIRKRGREAVKGIRDMADTCFQVRAQGTQTVWSKRNGIWAPQPDVCIKINSL